MQLGGISLFAAENSDPIMDPHGEIRFSPQESFDCINYVMLLFLMTKPFNFAQLDRLAAKKTQHFLLAYGAKERRSEVQRCLSFRAGCS
jgi:hypothetical protein